ncbi:MAG: hypothetical protein AUI10_10855 [Actinobacteria bacterium 13_2_20CM_2_72_6]|nr:MAG: hypothetical protein AUI10_10855 [Actinobacteria bacterium 13_2_20CM_2_72_6]
MRVDTGRRWLAVGRCTDADPRRAGREAARQAWVDTNPALLIVFCSGQADPAAVLAGIEEVFPGVPLIGCSAQAVIAADGLDGPGVVVTALGGPGFAAHTGLASADAGCQRDAGAAVAGSLAELAGDRPHRVLLLLTDGSVRDQEEILAGAYSVVGASVPLIGGTCGPDPALGHGYQLRGRDVATRSVAGAVIASDAPFGIGLGHGCRKIGEPMIVTRSVRGEISTLDDQPALQAYLGRLDAPPEVYRDQAAYDEFTRRRPIGIRRRNGEEVRHVNLVPGPEGRLRSSGEVPEGGLIWVLEGDRESTLDAAAEACQAAVEGLDGFAPLGLIAFDCISRSRVLGEEGTRQEVERMLKVADGAPLAGFYTWGEIARTRGITGYHNQTLAVLAVA